MEKAKPVTNSYTEGEQRVSSIWLRIGLEFLQIKAAEDHGIATTSNRANYQSKARSDLLDFVGGGGLRCRAPAALHGFGEQQVQAAEARRCRLLEEAADTDGRGGVLSCVGAASSITGGLQRRRQQDLQACTRGRASAAGT
ncbi:hypothetical protein OsI_22157 [Oryza sativa Indica Group]|uniref:Uncharacterized protein n=1 Tax=Oryza sativa subsp. indica TaxID=39946 RepID=B8B3Z5_ORYSI|nr:hypothetical protein OsI_22157 [Oryza sativa Indica Group]